MSDRDLRQFMLIADRTTDFLWQSHLSQLRSLVPRGQPTSSCPIHMVEQVHLPEDVRNVLGHGPKFAVQTKRTAPELLSYVRQVSRLAPNDESQQCISRGVDVLPRYVEAITTEDASEAESRTYPDGVQRVGLSDGEQARIGTDCLKSPCR
ncbi:hypothetical protein HPB50_029269 [Hyalomma asiaticum]|nr:hypothetical protein HPB50_029269 [Hyalomma asiaticum]